MSQRMLEFSKNYRYVPNLRKEEFVDNIIVSVMHGIAEIKNLYWSISYKKYNNTS